MEMKASFVQIIRKKKWCFWAFCYILLVSSSVCTVISSWFHGFKVCLRNWKGKYSRFVLLKNFIAIYRSLFFYVNLRITAILSNYSFWDFNLTFIEYIDWFGENWHLQNVHHFILKHVILIHPSDLFLVVLCFYTQNISRIFCWIIPIYPIVFLEFYRFLFL